MKKLTAILALIATLAASYSHAGTAALSGQGAGSLSPNSYVIDMDISLGDTIRSFKGYHVADTSGFTNYCTTASVCYHMNGTSDETDLTANAVTLTQTGTLSRTATYIPSGYSDYSRTFPGTGNYLGASDASKVNITGSISLGAWVYITAISEGLPRPIIAKYNTTNNNRQYALSAYGSGGQSYFRIALSPDGIQTTAVETTLRNYSLNTWYHVAAVYNGTDIRLYVNGVLASTPVAYTSGLYNATNNTFRLGKYVGASNDFQGYMDEVFVSDYALSASDIKNIYNNGMTGKRGGVAYATALWTLPKAIKGMQHCFGQGTGEVNVLKVTPQTDSFVELQDQTDMCASGQSIVSSGGVGDYICYIATDAHHWRAFGGAVGAWACQ